MGRLFWNVWADSKKPPTFQPLPKIAPGESFFLILDVSTLAYRDRKGVQAGEALVELVKRYQDDGAAELTLNLIVVPDTSAYLDPPFQSAIKLDLSKLNKLLAAQPEGEDPTASGVSAAKQLSIGRVALPLRVRAKPPRAGPIAVSIWDEDWSRPLEDLHVTVQIGGGEPIGPVSRTAAFSGLEAIGAGGPAPDAAVHFLALGPNAAVQAILRARGAAPEAFVHWSLGGPGAPVTPGALRASLAAVSKDLGLAAEPSTLVLRGNALHDLLFPGKGGEALAALIGPNAAPALPTKTLYVRMLTPGSDAPLALPVSFVRPPKKALYVGDVFAVETPLERRPWAPPPSCISRWAVLQPPEPSSNDLAMIGLREGIGVGTTPQGRLPSWKKDAEVYTDDILAFRDWIAAAATTDSSVLVLMSHQSDGRFSFDATGTDVDHAIRVQDFRRRFRAPSVAILAGCETGGPASNDLIRRLNRLGVSSMIATSTPADGAVLGVFLDLFAAEVAAQPGGKLGDLFERALRKLRSSDRAFPDSALRPRALQFTLIGDRRVPVCPPTRSTP